MTGLKILLLFGLLGVSFGQDASGFFVTNEGIFQAGETLVNVYEEQLVGHRVNICYNGRTLFVIDAFRDQTEIFALENGVKTTIDTFLSSSTASMTCCCNYLAYGYLDDQRYIVTVRRTDDTTSAQPFEVENTEVATLLLDCERQLISIVTETAFLRFNINSPPSLLTLQNLRAENGDLLEFDERPRCSVSTFIEDTEYIVVTFDDVREFIYFALSGDDEFVAVTKTLSVEEAVLRISCVAEENGILHFFARDDSALIGYLLSQSLASIQSSGIQVDIPPSINFDVLQGVGTLVNGRAVCDACTEDPCLDTLNECDACDADPAFDNCGFCSPGGDVCLCADPAVGDCEYESEDLRNSCQRPTPKLDASCVVLNPVAQRRSGGSNGVAIVVSGSEQVSVSETEITRAAKTGRWGVLPRWTDLGREGQRLEGYETDVKMNQRGRRFGFFDAKLTREDSIEEHIICIATEKSAFINKKFTYVVEAGGSIDIDVEMNNSFVDQVRWRRRSLTDPSDITDFTEADGSLTLSLTSVTKAAHEGIYEAFRAKRYLRTWHPIIYLYVRDCPFGSWSLGDCTGQCSDCNDNGICDVLTGACRCYPGFQGDNCETTCSNPNMFGQSCDIDCNTIFRGDGGNDCLGLSLCSHDELGCHCRSGLLEPDCVEGCPPDTWGNNCEKSCEGCDGCDARVGCP